MTRLPLILLLCLCLVGCSKPHPCNDAKGKTDSGYSWPELGFQYMRNGVAQSHCIPCSEAKSPEARFVCFGEVADKGAK